MGKGCQHPFPFIRMGYLFKNRPSSCRGSVIGVVTKKWFHYYGDGQFSCVEFKEYKGGLLVNG